MSGGVIGRADIVVGADASGFSAEVKGKTEGPMKTLGGVLGDSLSWGLKASAAVAGTAIAAVLGTALTAGFSRLNAIDKATAKLTGLGHSGDTVKTIMDNALSSVKGTAYGLGDAASQAATMVAAGIAPGEALTRTMKLLADTTTIAGTNLTDVGSIMTKVATTGKLQGDSLAQLQKRNIPVLKFLAEHYGITREAASKMVSQGKVDFENFQQAMEKGIGGAALSSGATFEGGLENVRASLGRLGEALLLPAFEGLKTMWAPAIAGIDNLTTSLLPLMEAFSARLTPAIEGLVEKMEGMATVDFGGMLSGLSGMGPLLGIVAGAAAGALGPLLSGLPVVGGLFSGLTGPVGLVIASIGLMMSQSPALREALGGALSEIGNVLGALSPVFGMVSDLVGTLAATFGDVLGAALSTVMPILVQLTWALMGTLVPALAQLTPVIEQVVGVLGDALIAAITTLLPPLMELAASVVPMLADVFAMLVPVIAQLVQAVLPVLMSIVEALLPVIVALLDPLMQLVSSLLPVLMSVVEALLPVLAMVGPLFATIIEAILPLVVTIAEALIPIVEALLPVVETVFNFIATTITNVMRVVEGIINVVMGAIEGDWSRVWTGIKQIFGAIWDQIKATVKAAIDMVKSVISAVLTTIQTLWNTVWNVIFTVLSGIWNSIKSLVKGAIDSVSSTISGVLNSIKSTWDSVWSSVSSFLSSTWNGMILAVVGFIRDLLAKVNSIKSQITGVFSGAASWLKSAGQSIIQGLIDGIKGMVSKVKNAVGNVMQAARDLLPFSPAKEGPFSGKGWTLYSGRSIVDALADGVIGREDALVGSMRGVMSKAQRALNSPLSLPMAASVGAGQAAPAALEGGALTKEDLDYLIEGLARVLWPAARAARIVEDFAQNGRARARRGSTDA